MQRLTLEQRLEQAQATWAAAGLERRLFALGGVDFCTNDYLGLARDERLIEAACNATRTMGAGAGAARLLGGHMPEHAAAEEEAARWLGTETALLFASGWHANLALMQVLPQAGDLILSDRLNHASLIDGMRLSSADVEVFAHNSAEDLTRRLEQSERYAQRWIVCESVYSTDGSLAPLDAYMALAQEHDAWLVVDEAHAAGLYGPRGEGRAGGPAEETRIAARTVTGGKALGSAGAFVGTTESIRQALLQRGRAFIFTTAPPPGPVAALRAAMRIIQDEPERRVQVHANAARLRKALATQGVRAPGESPIVPVLIGDPEEALRIAAEVQRAGYEARAVRPPTVPPGQSCLRVVCHANHRPEEIDELAARIGTELAGREDHSESCDERQATPLIVLGTDTDVGKTIVSALLCRAAQLAGHDVRFLKPLQTGTELDTPRVAELARLEDTQLLPPLVALPLPASVDQAALDAGVRVDAQDVIARTQTLLRAKPDALWILETAGGLLVPLNEREDQSDVVKALGGPAVLVARSGLGTLNHTRLTLEAMRRRGIRPKALFLVGPRHAANVLTLQTLVPEVPLLEIPWFETVDTDALDTWIGESAEALRGLFT